MTDTEQKTAAKRFAAQWQGKGYEKGQSQIFWTTLLTDVLGVKDVANFITYEEQVKLDNTSFIDGVIPSTHVLIEQKSLGKSLKDPIKQSDGTMLNPFSQAKRYSAELPYSQRPRWIVTCNFAEFNIYDMERPGGEPEVIYLKDLEREYYRLQFLVDTGNDTLKKEMEVSLQAGEIVGVLYDALLKQYRNPDDVETLKSLNKLCVRLVFCLYAEDAGIFGGHGMFHDYLRDVPVSGMRKALVELFKVLDTKPERRDKYLADDNPKLAAFPYVNGGLFADETVEIPPFTEEIKSLLLKKASEDFDWSAISPTIFGAVFESTLNPETRRSGGMHYTSIENIHKVIDPLFLDDLKAELEEIRATKVKKTRSARLSAYQKKLAGLVFLDPACGSGNFLTETYLSLRRLENEAIAQTEYDQIIMGAYSNPILVSIEQFYGIEINDFAVTVAKTALWIAESQMMEETEAIINHELDFLPLKTNANITEGNALRIDWETVVPKYELNYIMGNPPFVGARMMDAEQKADLNSVFPKWKNAGNLDYVSCWYKKAADMMKGTAIRAALVSTNSVTQGESVANLWKPLFDEGVHIDFAHRTFRWDSEAKIKAHVHCVIIGFSVAPSAKPKVIYSADRPQIVNNINGYLLDAENVSVERKSSPICDVPEMVFGSMANDDEGKLSKFSSEEKEELCSKYPVLTDYFRRFLGSREYINNGERWCLWFYNKDPSIIRKIPPIEERITKVKEARSASPRDGTRKMANYPYLFAEIRQPDGNYILVPRVSSENRKYVPMSFLPPDVIASDATQIIPNATLYHFGILTSNVHMAWMRAVCGRLEMRYRYSKDVVYNNFPWPSPTEKQRTKIEQTAQAILDARALYPNASLADLYDELTMPPELRKAHQSNDRAVMAAYGFDVKTMTESSCVAELMKMYRRITEEQAARRT